MQLRQLERDTLKLVWGSPMEICPALHAEVLRIAKSPTGVGLGPSKTITKLADGLQAQSPKLVALFRQIARPHGGIGFAWSSGWTGPGSWL